MLIVIIVTIDRYRNYVCKRRALKEYFQLTIRNKDKFDNALSVFV